MESRVANEMDKTNFFMVLDSTTGAGGAPLEDFPLGIIGASGTHADWILNKQQNMRLEDGYRQAVTIYRRGSTDYFRFLEAWMATN
jgi:hypothetical protein